jgi:hypothetical protein
MQQSNQIQNNKKRGRPSKSDILAFSSEKALEKIWLKYVEQCKTNNLPFIIKGFICHLGISTPTFYKYIKQEIFKDLHAKMSDLSEFEIIQAGLQAKGNVEMHKFLLKNLFGYKDKTDVVSNNTHKLQIERVIISPLNLENGKNTEAEQQLTNNPNNSVLDAPQQDNNIIENLDNNNAPIEHTRSF